MSIRQHSMMQLTMNYDKEWFHQVDDKDESLVDGWIEETMRFVKDTYQMGDSEIKDLEHQGRKGSFSGLQSIYKYVEATQRPGSGYRLNEQGETKSEM